MNQIAKKRICLILVDDEPEVLDALRNDLQSVLGAGLEFECCESGEEALELLEELNAGVERGELMIPIVTSDYLLGHMSGICLFREIRRRFPSLCSANILLSGQADFDAVKEGVNEGLIQRCLSKPWNPDELYSIYKDLLSEYLLNKELSQVVHYQGLVSHHKYSEALLRTEEQKQELRSGIQRFQHSLISPQTLDTKNLKEQMEQVLREAFTREELDDVLRTYSPGEMIFAEGSSVDSLRIIVSGAVSLTKQMQEGSDDFLYQEGVGSILGALAHFSHEPAFTTARALGKVDIVQLDQEKLTRVMESNLSFSALFTNILLRQVMERVRFNTKTALKLSQALRDLKSAQVQLVESEKLATLGQLVAGVAHELNNPTAALIRSADHLNHLIKNILFEEKAKSDLDPALLEKVFARGEHPCPLSTREIRTRSKSLESASCDSATSRKLAEMGFSSTREVLEIQLNGRSLAEVVHDLDPFFESAKALRNLGTCGLRIAALVKSLKNYARPTADEDGEVNLVQGLEDSMMILHNRLKRIRVEKDYGELPPVWGIAGELNQVWTNILSNALDALAGRPDALVRIIARAEEHAGKHEVVLIFEDNGPGIPVDKRNQIFELNFTTKKAGHFGLGMGLTICQRIILKHHGCIDVESSTEEPSSFTRFIIRLPSRQSPH